MMECNKDEAIRAKDIAEKKMQNNDFEGARRIALKAQQLFPELENINQLLTVCNVHCTAQNRIHGTEKDLYGILQLDKFADEVAIKKQYRKLALTLHPDKNKLPGSEAAFKLVGEANVVLLDPGKRAVYDNKCKVSIRNSQAQPPQYQFSSRQTTPTPSVIQGTFWTACHYCKSKFQYLKKYANHIVPCQKCTKPFPAYDLSVYGAPNTSNMGKPQPKTMPPGKDDAKIGPASKRRAQGVPSTASGNQTPVFPPKDTSHVGSSRTGVPNTAATHTGLQGNDSNKTVGSGFGMAGSAANGGQVKSSNKVGSNLNSVAGGKHEGKKAHKKEKLSGVGNTSRKRKHVEESSESCDTSSSNDPGEDPIKEDSAKSEGNGYSKNSFSNGTQMEKIQKTSNSIDIPYPEFTDFDKDKEEHCFSVNQMWALYDTLDGMPRFYALIKKVFKSRFELQIRWLEGNPEDDGEISWFSEELPFACGRFRWGESQMSRDRLSFSHQVHYEKGKKRASIYVRPRKGEIWALIKDWDINWNSDPENHKKYKFEIVEVVSDFCEDAGISVSYLDKVKGFVCLFQRASLSETDNLLIQPDQMLRFSHSIPASKMTGTERQGVPVGSFELDPAALPLDPDDICYPLKVISDDKNLQNGINRLGQKSENGVLPGKKDVADLNANSVRRSPRGIKTNDRK